MTRILAVADETSRSLTVGRIREIAPDLVVSCGDLPFDYLEYLVTAANVPLLFVPGNHDPELRPDPGPRIAPLDFEATWGDDAGPAGCRNVDVRIAEAAGLRVAGLGGSIRYRPGPNQYSQREMSWRAHRLTWKWLRRRAMGRGDIDVLITHSPPRNVGDRDDEPHRGFETFNRLLRRLRPKLMLHGHIHPHGFTQPEHLVGRSRILNVVPFRIVEVEER